MYVIKVRKILVSDICVKIFRLKRKLTNCPVVVQALTEAAVLYRRAANSAILLRTIHSSDEMRLNVSFASESVSRLR